MTSNLEATTWTSKNIQKILTFGTKSKIEFLRLTQDEFDNITDKSMFRDNFQFKHSKSSQQLGNGCDSHLIILTLKLVLFSVDKQKTASEYNFTFCLNRFSSGKAFEMSEFAYCVISL